MTTIALYINIADLSADIDIIERTQPKIESKSKKLRLQVNE